MLPSKPHRKSTGFTLIEMLVIAPIALLIITGFITLMIRMVGDVMVSHGKNEMTLEIQSSLDMIEKDVQLSTQFLDTTGALPSPQGKNSSTTAFTSTSGDLILGEIATNKNIIDPTREFIYYNTPFGCTDPAQKFKNRIYFTTVIYFRNGGSLWRRTFAPTPTPINGLCENAWQVSTCAPGYSAASTACKTNDTEVMKNVSSFNISYFANPADATPIGAASAPNASTINIEINGQRTVAGQSFASSAAARATKLTEKDIRVPPPGIPTVTAESYSPADPNTGTFTWPADPLVSYSVRYNINGGAWVMAAENTKQNFIKVTANRTDTISVQVSARNTTGSSGYGAGASITMPAWESCAFSNGWVNYLGGYAECGYTITKDGVVSLKGQVKNGPTGDSTLFRLPEKYRPTFRLIFQTVISPNSSTRIQVNDDGWVWLIGGSSNLYVGLDGINFIPDQTLYNWTLLSLQNGWANYGSPFAQPRTTVDQSGRVHVQGLMTQGTFADRTVISQLPSGSNPGEYHHMSTRANGYSYMGITGSGAINAKNVSSAYHSAEMMFYPATHTGWTNFGFVAGTPADNQIGNGWVAYGGEYTTPAFTKSDDGIVTIKGLVRSGATANLTMMGKLPPGYRPLVTRSFVVPTASGVGRIDIGENGWLQIRLVNASWTSLDGISYVAEW